MITLTLFLITGAIIREPISTNDCRDLIGIARFVDASGQTLVRDEGTVAALTCGDRSVVLMLPPSSGDCEMGETS